MSVLLDDAVGIDPVMAMAIDENIQRPTMTNDDIRMLPTTHVAERQHTLIDNDSERVLRLISMIANYDA